MSAYPTAFFALLSRTQVAKMLAPTIAKLRNLEPNEAYARVDEALRAPVVLRGVQDATWLALRTREPEADIDKLLARADRRLAKRQSFRAAPIRARDEAGWIALSVLVDHHAGYAGGEAMGLLDSEEGRALTARGFALAGGIVADAILG